MASSTANGDSTRIWRTIRGGRSTWVQQVALGRLQIYNRCDGYEDRAAHIKVLLSRDGQEFSVVYTHDGTVFRGHPDQQPLTVSSPGPDCQVHPPATSWSGLLSPRRGRGICRRHRNELALDKPATQSSVSQWSVRHTPHRDAIDWPQVVSLSIAQRIAAGRGPARVGSGCAGSRDAPGIDRAPVGPSSIDRLMKRHGMRCTLRPAKPCASWHSPIPCSTSTVSCLSNGRPRCFRTSLTSTTDGGLGRVAAFACSRSFKRARTRRFAA